jgi:mannose-6-phosphate isomerase-like protein (cupin superfamily)
MKKGYFANLEVETAKNEDYRRVLYTARNCQLVLMSLLPGEEIGNEAHRVDQFLRFEKGEGKVILNHEDEHLVKEGDGVVVPAGIWHNVVNTSKKEKLKLYTLYSPPEHKDGVVEQTKKQADADGDDEFEGVTTEDR